MTTGHERVLVVAPHPDDEVAGCAGTLIRHVRLGDSVRLAVVTDGRRSAALALDPHAMAAQRETEARLAAARMGIELRWLAFREGEWTESQCRTALGRIIAETMPTIVYAPPPDFHPEHRRTARVLAESLTDAGSSADVRIYAVQVPLTPLLTNLVHDVSDLQDEIRSTVTAYTSQETSITSSLRARRYTASFFGAGERAESFFAVRPDVYAAFLCRAPSAFRPMGQRAWGDPLSFARGMVERLAWRRAAARPTKQER
jgi:LmbE family N-acetylglucosaminyl deacetylase